MSWVCNWDGENIFAPKAGLCPVRALDAYVHRAALRRKKKQISCFCFSPPKKVFLVTKQTLIRWIVKAITLTHESSDLPSPLRIRAHPTKSMMASKAFLSGVSLKYICDAASCSSPISNCQVLPFGPRIYARILSSPVLVVLAVIHMRQVFISMARVGIVNPTAF